MKVALISPNIESEKALAIISKHLVESILKTGVDIELITYTAHSPMSFFKKLKEMKKYDIIHLHHEYNLLGYYGLPFFFVFPLLKILGKKVIITMHTILPKNEKFPESRLKNILRKILYISQNRLIKNSCDLIHVNENFLKEILIRDYHFSPDKIAIIPQGVIDNIKIPDKQKSRKELALSGKIYLAIGNLTVDSGADKIISQADKIGKTILFVTNPRGANTGNAKKVQDFIALNREIVEKNNFQQYVRFDLRELPVDLWWKYLSACDIVLQAYRGGVRSGVFSEAMAARKPVIASDINFFKEMAKKYGSLLIAEKDEDFPQLIREAMQPAKYKAMQKECERYIKENRFSRISEKYKGLYANLFKNQ
ncbi:MAG: glycosyltransferase family 4 protein [Candidatus Nanoarchaeia archaeon]|nr:glycosyltransferase family 4 protein [Candidatus Nanoarchaeia archaeon]